jgi:hypothetical protein
VIKCPKKLKDLKRFGTNWNLIKSPVVPDDIASIEALEKFLTTSKWNAGGYVKSGEESYK